ncbi:MAG: NAD(P)-dependent oxidoreductase [Proteobacteria bacterium]|nr:NAD(P)-dependent oxidoreductase [Pseudomonadota bacterium]
MNVFVLGGTGAIGRHAVRALIADGHVVTALAHSARGAAWLDQQGVKVISVSIFDRARLSEGFAGQDAVINLATALPATARFWRMTAWAENIRIRTEGSATVVDAALDAGVPRLIQESVSMIYRDRGSQWIDESWTTDEYPMARSNLAAEGSADRFNRLGGAGVVMRFGWFYGPGARHSEEFLGLARRYGVCVMMGESETYVSSLHVADGGRAVAAALRADPGIYNVVDDEPLTKREFADALAHAAARRIFIRAPGRLARLFGDGTTSLTRSLRVSNVAFKLATGWSPSYRSARDGMIAMSQSHLE